MADFASLLEPISPERPSGENLYYKREFDEIKEARRQDDTAPMQHWEREIKSADYKLVARLAENVLKTKTKDLRIAVWLAEAWIYRDGLPGFISGLQFLRALLEKFWDSLHPEIDGTDLEDRFMPLEWFGTYFDPVKSSSPKLAICRLPLVNGKYDFFVYQESRRVGYESEAKDSEPKRKARDAFIAEGKISAENFDKAFDETPKAFYKQLAEGYHHSLTELSELDEFCRPKFGLNPPSFGALRKSIEEISNTVHILLTRKLKTDPDPVEPAQPTTAPGSASAATPQIALPVSVPSLDLKDFKGGEIASPDQAVLHILAAAQFLRRQTPASPISYLLLRALRWGEVRELSEIKSTELFAPSGETRVQLRNAAATQSWKLVLEIAENAMSQLTGRGWLDLQRYSVKACEELGYQQAAKALRAELKCLLADFPELPKAILNDDTGAANPETLAWLEKEGLLPTK